MIYRNSMKSVLAAALIATTLIGSASARESGPGNGGDGVLVNGRLYSLDLLEAGDSVAENPYFDPQVPAADDQEYAKILDRVSRALGHLPQAPIDLVARKLFEVSKLDPVFSLVTLQTIELYSWSLVGEQLRDIQDEDTNLSISPDRWVQLAIRRDVSIVLQKDYWAQLDPAHRAALVFHEVLYALLPPEWQEEVVPVGHGKTRIVQWSVQLSRRARAVVGYLFSRQLPAKGRAGLVRVLDGRFPVVGSDESSVNLTEVEPGRIHYNGSMSLFAETVEHGIRLRGWRKGQRVEGTAHFRTNPSVTGLRAAKTAEVSGAVHWVCEVREESDSDFRYVREPISVRGTVYFKVLAQKSTTYRGRWGDVYTAIQYGSWHEDRATEKVRVSAQDCSSQTESLIEKNLIGSSIRRGLD